MTPIEGKVYKNSWAIVWKNDGCIRSTGDNHQLNIYDTRRKARDAFRLGKLSSYHFTIRKITLPAYDFDWKVWRWE